MGVYMKRLSLMVIFLLTSLSLGFCEKAEMVVASFLSTDSSVGKTPNYFLPAPLEPTLPSSNVGKSPIILYRDGPPPHKSGPGLRFNTKEWFYVYTDHGASPNHFIPSGWMGDYEDLTLDTGSRDNPADGKTCIKITYDSPDRNGLGWAGMYWQNPVNNWGNKVGGYNLKGMKQLTFWARGAEGGEVVNEFKVGGIQGDKPDSDDVRIGPVVLTKEWKQYVIDLSESNMSHISGGFAWAASQDDNPEGMTFYLDEIRFER